MGHSDISVTLNIYTHTGYDDAKKELSRLKEARDELEKKKVCNPKTCTNNSCKPYFIRNLGL